MTGVSLITCGSLAATRENIPALLTSISGHSRPFHFRTLVATQENTRPSVRHFPPPREYRMMMGMGKGKQRETRRIYFSFRWEGKGRADERIISEVATGWNVVMECRTGI